MKGDALDEAVLCTSDSTYALKCVDTTNLLLLVPPKQVGLTGLRQLLGLLLGQWLLHPSCVFELHGVGLVPQDGDSMDILPSPTPGVKRTPTAAARRAAAMARTGIETHLAAERLVTLHLWLTGLMIFRRTQPFSTMPVPLHDHPVRSAESSSPAAHQHCGLLGLLSHTPPSPCHLPITEAPDTRNPADIGLQTQLQKVGGCAWWDLRPTAKWTLGPCHGSQPVPAHPTHAGVWVPSDPVVHTCRAAGCRVQLRPACRPLWHMQPPRHTWR
jgi:hypothetical protein